MTLRNAFADLATEATLDEINVKIPNLLNGKTPVSDEALYAMVETFNELVSRLNVLLSAKHLDGSLRTTVLNAPNIGTVTAITTLATLTALTNQVQLGGYLASGLVMAQTNLASQANINNTVG